jgi:RNA polymerase sigma factor (sigma-70 family)
MRHVRRVAAREAGAQASDAALLARFATSRDEEAFAALLCRHGPMVRGVCRRLLPNPSDADDVFQATFLVLVQRPGGVRRRGSVGSWLHGVAVRLALRARRAAARRRRYETKSSPGRCASPYAEAESRDLQTILDAELRRLPEGYRAPLVLCYLEGRPAAEAARQLSWPVRRVYDRLARARALLRARLTRRGLAPAAGFGAATLGTAPLNAAVPPALAAATGRLAALVLATGAGSQAGTAAALAHGVTRALMAARIQAAAAVVLLAGVLAGGVGLMAHQALGPKPLPAPGAAATAAAQEHLSEKPAGRVDAFGDPLPEGAVARLGTVRFRHGGFLGFVAFTPDGKTLISQGGDGVRFWEIASGREIHALPHETAGSGAALSLDGKWLATASESGAHIWDVATATLVRSFPEGHPFRVCWSPDAQALAVVGATEEKKLLLFDRGSGQPIWSWNEEKAHPMAAVFSPDRRLLIVGAQGGRGASANAVFFLDAQTGREERRIEVEGAIPNKLAVSPDGTLLAAVCHNHGPGWDDHVHVWEIANGKERFRLSFPPEDDPGRQKIFASVAFTPDGRSLVTSGGNEGLVFWDPASGNEEKRLGRGLTNSQDLAFSPDGRYIAAARSAVQLIDRATGEDVRPINHVGPVNSVALLPDGKTIATESNTREIILWDRETGRRRGALDQGKMAFRDHCGLKKDGRTIILSKDEGKTFIFRDLVTGKERCRLSLDFIDKWPGLRGIAPGGKLVAVGSFNGDTIHLMDTETGKRSRDLQDPDLKLRNVEFLSDGKTLLAFSNDHQAQVWDLTTGTKVRQFAMGDEKDIGPLSADGLGGSYEEAVSPDGTLFAYGVSGRIGNVSSLRFFETASGREVRRVERGDFPGSYHIAFTPDGRALAWGNVHLLEVASGRERHILAGHRGTVHTYTFSADGKTLVTGSSDTTALVWDLTGRADTGPQALSVAELDACWADLAGEDAARAYRAIRRLANAPAVAAPYLREHLKPVPPVDKEKVQRLVADLDDGDFATREAAAAELERIGEKAAGHYRKALQETLPAEARRRLNALG